MRIHKDCFGTIAKTWAFSLLALLLAIYFIPNGIVLSIVSALILVFMAFTFWFHRLPERGRNDDDRIISAVADGKVVIVRKAFEKEYFNSECIQVSVFMDFFDVHSNFWPMNGVISYYRYHEGNYHLAFLPKASEKNEHSSTVIKNDHCEILFRQIAGTFARRIVCYSEEGKQVESGGDCGIIKFGSRIDYFLPLDADIKVKVGDRTRASETIIAQVD